LTQARTPAITQPKALPSSDAEVSGFGDDGLDALRYELPAEQTTEAAEIILSMIPRGSRVLDVGCGTGFISVQLLDRLDAQVVGVEPNAERASFARRRGLDVVNQAYSHEVGAKFGSFDVVLFADVLEHVPDPAALLSSAREILRPAGCVIASIPNVAHWSVRLSLLFGHFDYQAFGIMDSTHLRWFTAAAVTRLFASEGFRIDEYRVSIDARVPEYCYRRPWCYVQKLLRGSTGRYAARLWPTLFGSQYIVKARSRANEPSR
jgi:methionine biosynthesis protein MetW